MKAWTPFGRAILVLGVLMLLAMMVAAQDSGDFGDDDSGDFGDDDTGDFDDDDSGDFDDDDSGDFEDDDSGDFDGGSTCPAVRETVQNMSPTAGKQYDCAANNGHLYEASDGHHFYIQCCTEVPTGPIFGLWADNFGACMDACAQEPSGRCRSVGFDSNPAPGDTDTCIFFGTGDFLTIDHSKYHYAFLVDPPTADHPDDEIKLCSTECPGSNNQVYNTPYGESFRMVCGKRHGTEAVMEQVDSWEQCMDYCGKLVQCRSVDYHRRTKRCYLGDHGGEPTIDAPGFSSAYSMGCAGACCDYPKPESPGPSEPETPPPPPPPPIVLPLPPGQPCPQLHNTKLTVNSQEWQIKCSYVDGWVNGGSRHDLPTASSMEECIQHCQNHAPCVWSEFRPSDGLCGGYTKDYSQAQIITDNVAQGHFNLIPA